MKLFNVASLLVLSLVAPVRGAGESCSGRTDCPSGNFCGTDSTCHWWGCMDYYKYGPANFTGHDGSAMDDVTCESFTATDSLAVSYACDMAVLTGPIPPEEGFGLKFNLKCTAMPVEGLTFECFDLAPDTDFSAFSDAIANSPPIDCASNMVYVYQAAVSYTKLTDEGGIDQQIINFSPGGVTFDPAFALNVSMFSTLVSDLTPSPTSVGNVTMIPSAVPVAPSSAAKVAVTGSACLLAALALLL